MQKFTRALTREVEVAGERLAVTLSEEGLTVRPVGSRRPPHTMSWAACLCALVGKPSSGATPAEAEIQEAVKALKSGAEKPAARKEEGKEQQAHPGQEAPAAPPPPHHDHHTPPHDHHAPPAPSASHVTMPATPPAPPLHPPVVGPSVPALLRRIDRWMAAHRPRFYKGLLPGAVEADLQTLRQALGAPVPAGLADLLRWHNGQNADVFGAFEQGWNLMSARQIADAKQELDARPPAGWQRSWLPVLEDDSGSSYLTLDAGTPGLAVRACWAGNDRPELVAPTLAGWLGDFAAALDAGKYHEDPERGTFHRGK